MVGSGSHCTHPVLFFLLGLTKSAAEIAASKTYPQMRYYGVKYMKVPAFLGIFWKVIKLENLDMSYNDVWRNLNIPISPPTTTVPLKLFLTSTSTESHEQEWCALNWFKLTSSPQHKFSGWLPVAPQEHHRTLLLRNFSGQWNQLTECCREGVLLKIKHALERQFHLHVPKDENPWNLKILCLLLKCRSTCYPFPADSMS